MKIDIKKYFKKLPSNSPKFMIIGTQKGGTTALYEYLSMHHQISPCVYKELNFFNSSVKFQKGYSFYHSYFPSNIEANKITFDASPSYLTSANCSAKRIKDYNPKIKLIALLRNPISRAFSAWNMYKVFYKKNKNWFFDWVINQGDNNFHEFIRRTDESFGLSFYDDILFELKCQAKGQYAEMCLLPHGLYVDQLEIYLKYFKNDQLLIIDSDSFEANTLLTLREIENFLNIKPENWSLKNISPRFVGDYNKNSIEADAYNLLYSYYIHSNLKLKKNYNINYL